MTLRPRRAGIIFLAALAVELGAMALSSPAQAQIPQYPPCILFLNAQIVDPGPPPQIRVDIRLVCDTQTIANAHVGLFTESKRVHIGDLVTDSKGEATGTFEVPSSIGVGHHTFVADVENVGEITKPVAIGLSDAAKASNAGQLPVTPSRVAVLGLWALLLVALATMLVLAKRGTSILAPLRRSDRRRHTSTRRQLPEGDVPFLDTSGFVASSTHRAPGTDSD